MRRISPTSVNVIDAAYLDTPSCSTVKKLTKFEEKVYDIDHNRDTGNRIIEFRFLQDLVGSLSCQHCNGKAVSVHETRRDGLASIITIFCNTCAHSGELCTSHRIQNNESHTFEVNRLVVSAFRDVGCGQAASQLWFSAMNIPSSLSKRTFASHSKALSATATETANDILDEASKLVHQAYAKSISSVEKSSVIDISVAFDGTWHRHGHRSHYGVGVVTELLTGLVIDYEVMSTYCFGCQVHAKDDRNAQSYKDWIKLHKENCNKTFSGSANAMESAAALKCCPNVNTA